MGTSAIIRVFEEYTNSKTKKQVRTGLVSIYSQADGYLEGRGKNIADFLKDREFISGITGEEIKASNGAGCFAAELVMFLKQKFKNNRHERLFKKTNTPFMQKRYTHRFGQKLTPAQMRERRNGHLGGVYLAPWTPDKHAKTYSFAYDIIVTHVPHPDEDRKYTPAEIKNHVKAFKKQQREFNGLRKIFTNKKLPQSQRAKAMREFDRILDERDRKYHEERLKATSVTVHSWAGIKKGKKNTLYVGDVPGYVEFIKNPPQSEDDKG